MKQQVTGKEVPRMVAIINSMTKKERRNPALLNGSRRARIAARLRHHARPTSTGC